jgi:type I restriction enzyme S subunit
MTRGGLPRDWKEVELGSVLKRIKKPVDLNPSTIYREIGIRSHGKGIFYKEERTGDSIGEKSVFWVEPNCFIVNIVFAWEQAIAKTTISEKGMIASHRFPMYKPIQDRLDLDYLVYFFNSPYGKYLLGLASPGGAGRNKTLGQEDFLNLSIPLPPVYEQHKIIEVLTTWDTAITQTDLMVATLHERKRGLMQRLLTSQVRFSGFIDKWKEDDLGKFANVRRGASPRPISNPEYFAESGRGWIRISDVTKEPTRFLNSASQYLSELGESKSVKVEVGDLIMSICATIGVPKIVNIPACIHDGFVLFSEFEQRYNKEFLYHYINFIAPLLASGGQPGTQKNLNTDIVRKIKIPTISLAEQSKIVDVLNTSDEEISLYSQKLETLKQQKKGLMQQLLTGQVRVKV